MHLWGLHTITDSSASCSKAPEAMLQDAICFTFVKNKVKDKADNFVVCEYIFKYFESVKDHGIFYQFLS